MLKVQPSALTARLPKVRQPGEPAAGPGPVLYLSHENKIAGHGGSQRLRVLLLTTQ